MPRQRSRSPKRSNPVKDAYDTFWKDCTILNIDGIKKGLEKVDPTCNNNAALEYVLKSQYDDEEKVEALKILLNDPRIKLEHLHKHIPCLFTYDHVLSLEYLIYEKKIPFDNKNTIANLFITSIGHGAYKCVDLLLRDKNINVTKYASAALAQAYGRYNILHMLLQDPRIDPTKDDTFVQDIIEGNHYDCLKLIMADPRIKIPCDNIPRSVSEPIKRLLTEYKYRLDGEIYNTNIIK
uniref:Ankyrin repeat protein n=1 Tax=viral metagenome TaxID=1070528 RepID=A0A6C0JTF0_9ZZZZ